jgi:dienelactone hydrolase
LSGKLYRPKAAGAVPVVIVLHTCSGIGDGHLVGSWVDRLNDWGYAAFVLDSFSARNISSVCAPEDQGKVTAFDRAGDVINAAIVLAKVPGIDGNRIGAVGMSHGGVTAAVLTTRVFETYKPGLIKASVDYYGPCRQPDKHGTVPLLALAGEADNWGNPAKTCAEFQKALAPDQPMELQIYPGVVHSFDNDMLTRATSEFGHPLKYDYAAAKDSFARTHAFLGRYVRDAK